MKHQIFHVATDYEPWDLFGKFGPVINLLETKEMFQNGQIEYIVMLDSTDVTLVKSPHDIVKSFEYYDADMIMMGETTGFPKWLHRVKSDPWVPF